MSVADQGGRIPDLYQLLGVPREASRQEIALAWRRRARDEHPDARPADTDAPDRFRVLAQAWQVLGDPVRRAAYDRSLAHAAQPTAPQVPGASVRVPVRYLGGHGNRHPLAGAGGPPLRAGPVRAETPSSAPTAAGPSEEEIMLAILAELASRYLGRPW